MKLKTYIKNIGNIVATLLMFSPIVILYSNTRLDKYWIILFILSVCYDFYIYSIIEFDDKIKKNKKLYFDILNGKTIESNTEEKKMKWYKVLCVSILSDYFKADFNNKKEKE